MVNTLSSQAINLYNISIFMVIFNILFDFCFFEGLFEFICILYKIVNLIKYIIYITINLNFFIFVSFPINLSA